MASLGAWAFSTLEELDEISFWVEIQHATPAQRLSPPVQPASPPTPSSFCPESLLSCSSSCPRVGAASWPVPTAKLHHLPPPGQWGHWPPPLGPPRQEGFLKPPLSQRTGDTRQILIKFLFCARPLVNNSRIGHRFVFISPQMHDSLAGVRSHVLS